MQAGALPRSQVQCSRTYGAVGFNRKLPPALGERVRRGRGQARAE